MSIDPQIGNQFNNTAPFFCVSDFLKSVKYYHEALGFDYPKLWGEPPCFAMLSRDGLVIMLSQTDKPIVPIQQQGGSWDVYIWINNADALFEEFKNNGATIEYEPRIRELYGMKEFAVKDPDGHVLAFGQGDLFA